MNEMEKAYKGQKMDSSDSLRIPITIPNGKKKSTKGILPEQPNKNKKSFGKYNSQPASKGMKKVYRNPGR